MTEEEADKKCSRCSVGYSHILENTRAFSSGKDNEPYFGKQST